MIFCLGRIKIKRPNFHSTNFTSNCGQYKAFKYHGSFEKRRESHMLYLTMETRVLRGLPALAFIVCADC